MVLLLLALLSGVVLQALVAARMELRAGDERQSHFALQSAVLDSAWAALHTGMKAGTAASEYQVFEDHRPNGIETRTTLQGLPREALPPPLVRPDVPLFGQFFAVLSRAQGVNRSSQARALACRLPTGDVRILAWVEYP